MEPRPEKDNPEIPSSDRPKSDLSPEEREIWAEDEEELEEPEGEEEDLEELPGDGAGEDESYDPLDEDLDPPDGPTAEPELREREEAEPVSGVRPPGSGEEAPLFPRYSRREVIWLGALGLVLLLVGAYFLKLFFGDINTSTPDEVDFPVKGGSVVIREIQTFWRKPDREVDKGVRLEAKFIPAAEIRLKSSGSGSLRFFFENPEGDLVGDSVTLEFAGGSFEQSGDDTASIYATSGFEDLGAYNDYLTEQVHFWHLVVLEGPGLQADGSEYKEILRMRISPKRR